MRRDRVTRRAQGRELRRGTGQGGQPSPNPEPKSSPKPDPNPEPSPSPNPNPNPDPNPNPNPNKVGSGVAGGLSSGLSRAASGTGAAMRASAPQLAGTVSVRVVRATGLLAADRGGTSDPYVVVQSAGGKKAKTSVKKRTLDPEWDETLELSVYDASAPLSFAVWDHDKVGTNDSLGAGEVLLGQCAPGAPTSLRVALSTQGAIEVVVTFSPAEPAVELRELTAAAAGATAAGAAGGASGARAARTAAMAREAATPQVVPAFASGAAPLSPASYLRRLVPFGGGSSAGQAAASSPEDSGSFARAV